jgi:hypothetical protein
VGHAFPLSLPDEGAFESSEGPDDENMRLAMGCPAR